MNGFSYFISSSIPGLILTQLISDLDTLDGGLYLAVVEDACCRRTLGWSMKTCQDTKLMSEASQMALRGRGCEGVIHNSDQGVQNNSRDFQALCRAHGIKQSMGSVGDC